mgnify:CR=1 FL=1
MRLPTRPRAIFDCEVYRDYFLVCFQSLATGKKKHFEMYEGHPLDRECIKRILRHHTVIGFNSGTFDVQIIRLALRVGSDTTILKRLCDDIIVRQMRPWDAEKKYNLPDIPFLDHIDLIEPSPSVQVGLKLYGGRLNSKRLQDLPLNPSVNIFDFGSEVRETMIDYCYNDCETTADLYRHIEKQIELREQMSEQYGLDLRSKSDAQIAEAVIKSELERIKGDRIYRPEFSPDYSFKYEPPSFLSFKTKKMLDVFEIVKNATFRLKKKAIKDDDDDSDAVSIGGVKVKISGIQMPPEIIGAKAIRNPVTKKIIEPKKPPLMITIGNSTYKMGIGGLHSTEARIAHHSDDEYVLIDNDVASYYPAIMLNCNLYPDHLGEDFLNVYRGIRERRIAAKRVKDKVTDLTLKIVLNGTFGKLGSKWSVLYAPNLMLQVTITGQLALLMLIEELELAGISVISANTDGIVSKCPRDQVDEMYEIISAWEKRTGFDMEQAIYESLYSMSVNSYIAVKAAYEGEKEVFNAFPFLRKEVEKGEQFKRGVKQKGLCAFAGSKGSPAEKNPTNYICVDAVINYLTKGIPLEETIEWCPDVRRFLTVRRVTGGAVYKGDYLGKTVRWYRAKGERESIRYAENGNLVSKSTGARPLMELDGTLPHDIDYDFYKSEAVKMLGELGVL